MSEKKETVRAPERHSHVVGGSTASQVMNCPASVGLCQSLPKIDTSTSYTRTGSMLHAAIASVIEENKLPEDMLGFELDGVVLDEDLLQEKLLPAVEAFDALLDKMEEEFGEEPVVVVETEVSFGRYIPDAFGSCDIILRCGPRVVVLDWKFGSGVMVTAEENSQLMFYAAAAMRTPSLEHMFKDAEDIDLVIIQPPSMTVWGTTFPRMARFETSLKAAVKKAQMKNPPLKEGKHCQWCKAKAICPLMNGAVDRAVQTDLKTLDVQTLGLAYRQGELLKSWLKELDNLIFQAMEGGLEVPGLKLVPKRGTRKWVNEGEGVTEMLIELAKSGGIHPRALLDAMYSPQEVLSPAQMEKMLKAHKLKLPEGATATVSSGSTIALAEDKREGVSTPAKLKAKIAKVRHA